MGGPNSDDLKDFYFSELRSKLRSRLIGFEIEVEVEVDRI